MSKVKVTRYWTGAYSYIYYLSVYVEIGLATVASLQVSRRIERVHPRPCPRRYKRTMVEVQARQRDRTRERFWCADQGGWGGTRGVCRCTGVSAAKESGVMAEGEDGGVWEERGCYHDYEKPQPPTSTMWNVSLTSGLRWSSGFTGVSVVVCWCGMWERERRIVSSWDAANQNFKRRGGRAEVVGFDLYIGIDFIVSMLIVSRVQSRRYYGYVIIIGIIVLMFFFFFLFSTIIIILWSEILRTPGSQLHT